MGRFSFPRLSTGEYRVDFTERFLSRDPLGFFAGNGMSRAIAVPMIVLDGNEPDFIHFELSSPGKAIDGRIAPQHP